MDFMIRVADRFIKIHSVYDHMYKLCQPYLVEEIVAPDIVVCSDEQLIRLKTERFNEPTIQVFNQSGVEQMVVLQLIAEELLSFDTLLMLRFICLLR